MASGATQFNENPAVFGASGGGVNTYGPVHIGASGSENETVVDGRLFIHPFTRQLDCRGGGGDEDGRASQRPTGHEFTRIVANGFSAGGPLDAGRRRTELVSHILQTNAYLISELERRHDKAKLWLSTDAEKLGLLKEELDEENQPCMRFLISLEMAPCPAVLESARSRFF